jgi:GDP-4-dehydro-6-deoxy-D-mannose reductase
MSRILVTGIEGFVGHHLAEHLLGSDAGEVHGTVFAEPVRLRHLADRLTLHRGDLRDPAWVEGVVEQVRPDVTFHLAAWSEVGTSWENPWAVYERNILCQVNLLEALCRLAPACRTLVVSSSEVYGAVRPAGQSIAEDAPLRPANPYAVSKAAQDLMAYQYWLSHRLSTIRARSFPHIGPGQSEGFAASAFAKQIAESEQGLREPVIRTGKLDVERDFTDVRDVVRAYRLLVAMGQPGESYNVGSGRTCSLKWVLEVLCGLSTVAVTVQEDSTRLRPHDAAGNTCDTVKLRQATGWQPAIEIRRTLGDILGYWRGVVRGNA